MHASQRTIQINTQHTPRPRTMNTNCSSPDGNSRIRDSIIAIVPTLRAFAISLSGNADRADDLVQETILRALANISSFEPGTNLSAWLFVILRNVFRSEYRKRRREVEDSDGRHAETLKTYPAQTSRIEFEEFRQALSKLPPGPREALILVAASGFSYEEAADICGCPVGTVKSRVNRARVRLAELLSIEGSYEFGPDQASRAVIAGAINMSEAYSNLQIGDSKSRSRYTARSSHL
jgi:RNA polymerase sigma-70 factor, ECF subfamily